MQLMNRGWKPRQLAEELLKTVNTELAAGADFAKLAEIHSEGPSAARGGALRGSNPKLPAGDYFARGEMVKPFEETAFDVLETRRGEWFSRDAIRISYNQVRREKKRQKTQPFAQVQYEIQQKLVQVSGVDEAKRISDDLLYEIENSGL